MTLVLLTIGIAGIARAAAPGATRLFACGIQIGAGLSGALAVPLADALGGWRDSLLVISLVCAAVAVAWIPVARAVHMPAGT